MNNFTYQMDKRSHEQVKNVAFFFYQLKRISGEFFRRFSGAGGGSFGRRRNFLVTAGLLSKISEIYGLQGQETSRKFLVLAFNLNLPKMCFKWLKMILFS